MKKKVLWLTTLFLFSGVIWAQEVDIENEINRTKREIQRLEEELTKVKKAAAQDRKEFKEYEKRTKERFSILAAETDSIRKASGVHQKKSAALGAELNRINGAQREYDIKQKKLSEKLGALCDEAILTTSQTPPSLSKKSKDALSFLKSELAASTIDNNEGINRLVQTINDLELQLMDIQISQGASPISEINGLVYSMRIGGVFEAVVDPKGEKAAVWVMGTPDKWIAINDKGTAESILKAIEIREGKTLPDFVKLPFSEAQGGAQ